MPWTERLLSVTILYFFFSINLPPVYLFLVVVAVLIAYFEREEIDGNDSPDKDSFYKKWYKWEMIMGPNQKSRIKLNYYIALSRDKNKGHFVYRMKPAAGFLGNVKQSEIIVNMPMDCKSIPFTMKKDYDGGQYVYSSLPRPAISKNLLQWTYSDLVPSEDLIIYFSCNNMPQWKVNCSNFDKQNNNAGQNMLDGNPRTFWASEKGTNPINTNLDFIAEGCNPKLYKIAMVPGNANSLSDFYFYSHLREAIMTVEPFKSTDDIDPDSQNPKKDAEKKRNLREIPRIEIDCSADWILQEFKYEKAPLNTNMGLIRMIVDTVYPGQESDQLCISEILLFDRQPNETYDNQY